VIISRHYKEEKEPIYLMMDRGVRERTAATKWLFLSSLSLFHHSVWGIREGISSLSLSKKGFTQQSMLWKGRKREGEEVSRDWLIWPFRTNTPPYVLVKRL
jgi:hypothetical protein